MLPCWSRPPGRPLRTCSRRMPRLTAMKEMSRNLSPAALAEAGAATSNVGGRGVSGTFSRKAAQAAKAAGKATRAPSPKAGRGRQYSEEYGNADAAKALLSHAHASPATSLPRVRAQTQSSTLTCTPPPQLPPPDVMATPVLDRGRQPQRLPRAAPADARTPRQQAHTPPDARRVPPTAPPTAPPTMAPMFEEDGSLLGL